MNEKAMLEGLKSLKVLALGVAATLARDEDLRLRAVNEARELAGLKPVDRVTENGGGGGGGPT